MGHENLSERKTLILKAIVEAHIDGGEPVGAETLSDENASDEVVRRHHKRGGYRRKRELEKEPSNGTRFKKFRIFRLRHKSIPPRVCRAESATVERAVSKTTAK